jgi:hypothetical protein
MFSMVLLPSTSVVHPASLHSASTFTALLTSAMVITDPMVVVVADAVDVTSGEVITHTAHRLRTSASAFLLSDMGNTVLRRLRRLTSTH